MPPGDPSEQHVELTPRRLWVRVALVGAVLLTLVQPFLLGYRAMPLPFDDQLPDTHVVQMHEDRLNAAIQRQLALGPAPTGSDVAMARWCLQQPVLLCEWGETEMTYQRALDVMTYLNSPPDTEIAWARSELAQAKATQATIEERTGPLPVLFALRLLAVHGLWMLYGLSMVLAASWYLQQKFRVRVRQFEIQFGPSAYEIARVRGAGRVDQHLELKLADGSVARSPVLTETPEALEECAARIRAVLLSEDERMAEARARTKMELQAANLAQRAAR